MKDNNLSVFFSFNKYKAIKEIRKLDKKKSYQESDIPVKISKKTDFVSNFVFNNVSHLSFSSSSKL